MTDKTVEQLLEEQNKLISEQNELLRQSVNAANAISTHGHMEEVRARARRNTPWYAKPPDWAR